VTTAERIERRLGFQSLFDFTDVTQAIDFAARHDFKALEINLGNPYYLNQLRSTSGRAKIRHSAKRRKIDLLCHSVDGLNYFLPDWQHVKANLAFMLKIVRCAGEAGAHHYTFHLGMDMRYGYSGDRKYTYEFYPDIFAANLRGVLQGLKDAYHGRMTLGIENVGGFRFDWVFPILHEEIGGRLCLTMDVGHINVYKGKVKEAEFNFFRDHARLIRSSHLHDNNAEWDQHDVIGRGTVDFLPYFRMLAEQNAYCIFEVRPKESALECLKRFRADLAPKL
jgi:sugar phosphate isomerase/epimerase